MVSATHPRPDDEDPQGPASVDLISLWVAPQARGREVGDTAVAHVIRWARRAHPGAPLMLDVKTGNERAVRLYLRHGFVDVGPNPADPTERRFRHAGGG